ncbi:lipocalin family protein, partial [Escherichia coli]|nr:lipocalin family protein [Escherichia coli]
NFNAEQFSGDWYHIERYDDLGGRSCIGTRYTVENDGITVLNFEVRDGELQTVEGSATIIGSNGGGVIELTFPVGDTTATTTSHVSILATDYTNFALAYSCTNVGSDQRQVRA